MFLLNMWDTQAPTLSFPSPGEIRKSLLSSEGSRLGASGPGEAMQSSRPCRRDEGGPMHRCWREVLHGSSGCSFTGEGGSTHLLIPYQGSTQRVVPLPLTCIGGQLHIVLVYPHQGTLVPRTSRWLPTDAGDLLRAEVVE